MTTTYVVPLVNNVRAAEVKTTGSCRKQISWHETTYRSTASVFVSSSVPPAKIYRCTTLHVLRIFDVLGRETGAGTFTHQQATDVRSSIPPTSPPDVRVSLFSIPTRHVESNHKSTYVPFATYTAHTAYIHAYAQTPFRSCSFSTYLQGHEVGVPRSCGRQRRPLLRSYPGRRRRQRRRKVKACGASEPEQKT